MASLITHQTSISANLVLFSRFLRGKGFSISAVEETDALKAISLLPLSSEGNYRDALNAVLSKNAFQRHNFNVFYDEFKAQLKNAADSKIESRQEEKEPNATSKTKELRFEALKDWLNLNANEEEKEIASYSDLNVLTQKNFIDLSEDEMRLMMRLLQRIAQKSLRRKSRLKKKSKKKKTLDLKRTIRTNMRLGGTIQQLMFSERKEQKLKLVLLCDVSRSMDLYSRFFIHLIYAFQNSYDKIETFVFSTALHRVSELFNNHGFNEAFETISDRVPQWSGGTTIGSCLYDFSQNYGHRHLDKKTIVLILSDGWDTGEPELMKEAMRAIYKRSKKLIWLNPLAGSPDFSPEVLGMQTALPYIDTLASAHNLESLKVALLQLG